MSQAEPNPLQPGTLVQERYRVMGIVGHGGLGTVYQVADILYGNATIYALKEQWDQSPSAQKQFKNEGEWLMALNHPSIPKVLQWFAWSGRLYLLMQFVEGENLERKLERSGGRPLPEAQVIAWVLPVCDALDYLHQRTPPIIHRDVKPSNIIVTSAGHTVLVDFGIAKEHAPGSSKTATFVRKAGTEGYAAPEQYSEQGQTGPWSDVYGLGATLYHLLTAQIPPTAVDRVALDVRLRRPREFNPAVSMVTESAILRALAIRPQDRFRTIADFKRALPNPASLPSASALQLPDAARRAAALEWPSTPAMPSGPHGMTGMTSPVPAVPVSTPAPLPLPLPSPLPTSQERGSGALKPIPPSGAVPVRSGWTPPARRPEVVRSRERPKPVRGKATARASARAPEQSAGLERPERSRLLAHPIMWGIGVVVLIALVAGGVFFATQFFAPLDRSSPTSTVTGYFAALHTQDYNRAWQYMTASQRGQTTESDFIASLRADDTQYGKVLSANLTGLNQDASGHVAGTVDVLRARAPNTPIVYTVVLTQYGGQWYIDSLVTS